jgi:hypothetical protein
MAATPIDPTPPTLAWRPGTRRPPVRGCPTLPAGEEEVSGGRRLRCSRRPDRPGNARLGPSSRRKDVMGLTTATWPGRRKSRPVIAPPRAVTVKPLAQFPRSVAHPLVLGLENGLPRDLATPARTRRKRPGRMTRDAVAGLPIGSVRLIRCTLRRWRCGDARIRPTGIFWQLAVGIRLGSGGSLFRD